MTWIKFNSFGRCYSFGLRDCTLILFFGSAGSFHIMQGDEAPLPQPTLSQQCPIASWAWGTGTPSFLPEKKILEEYRMGGVCFNMELSWRSRCHWLVPHSHLQPWRTQCIDPRSNFRYFFLSHYSVGNGRHFLIELQYTICW